MSNECVGKGRWGKGEDPCISSQNARLRGRQQDSEANKNSNDAPILRAGMVGEVENNARQHKEDQLALQARLYNTRVLLSLHCCKQKAMEGTRATG